MNIACPSCRTRFRVPDDKVIGRTVRLRCSKCDFAFVHGPDGPVLPPGFEAAPAAGGYTPTGPSDTEKAIAPFAALSRAAMPRVAIAAQNATMDMLAPPLSSAAVSSPVLAPPLVARPFKTMDFAAIAPAPLTMPEVLAAPQQSVSPAAIDLAGDPFAATADPFEASALPLAGPHDPFAPTTVPQGVADEWSAHADDVAGEPMAMPVLPVDAEFGGAAPGAGGPFGESGESPSWDHQAAVAAATVAAAEAQAFAEPSSPSTPLPDLASNDEPVSVPSTPSPIRRLWRRARPHFAAAAQVGIAVAAAATAVVWGRGESWSSLRSEEQMVVCEQIQVQQRIDPQGIARVTMTGWLRNRSDVTRTVYVDAVSTGPDDTTQTVAAIVGDKAKDPDSGAVTLAGGASAPFRATMAASRVTAVRPVVRTP